MSVPAAGGEAQATAQGDGVLAVRGALTFHTVPDLFRQSSAWMQKSSGLVTIDLKDVQRADSAGLALLVEWLHLARGKGRDVRFVNVPEQVRSLSRVNGLSRALGFNNHA